MVVWQRPSHPPLPNHHHHGVGRGDGGFAVVSHGVGGEGDGGLAETLPSVKEATVRVAAMSSLFSSSLGPYSRTMPRALWWS